MRCLYCGNELALLKKLTGGGEFCSEAHRQKYQEEYNRLALSRLLQAQPASTERPPLESGQKSKAGEQPEPQHSGRPDTAPARLSSANEKALPAARSSAPPQAATPRSAPPPPEAGFMFESFEPALSPTELFSSEPFLSPVAAFFPGAPAYSSASPHLAESGPVPILDMRAGWDGKQRILKNAPEPRDFARPVPSTLRARQHPSLRGPAALNLPVEVPLRIAVLPAEAHSWNPGFALALLRAEFRLNAASWVSPILGDQSSSSAADLNLTNFSDLAEGEQLEFYVEEGTTGRFSEIQSESSAEISAPFLEYETAPQPEPAPVTQAIALPVEMEEAAPVAEPLQEPAAAEPEGPSEPAIDPIESVPPPVVDALPVETPAATLPPAPPEIVLESPTRTPAAPVRPEVFVDLSMFDDEPPPVTHVETVPELVAAALPVVAESAAPATPAEVQAEQQTTTPVEPVADPIAAEPAPEPADDTPSTQEPPAPAADVPAIPRLAERFQPIEIGLIPAALPVAEICPAVTGPAFRIAPPSLDAAPLRARMYFAPRPDLKQPQSAPSAADPATPVTDRPRENSESPAKANAKDRRRGAQPPRPSSDNAKLVTESPKASANEFSKDAAQKPADTEKAVETAKPVESAKPDQTLAEAVQSKPAAEAPAKKLEPHDSSLLHLDSSLNLEGLRGIDESKGSAWSRMTTAKRIALGVGLILALCIGGFLLKSTFASKVPDATTVPAPAQVGANLLTDPGGWNTGWNAAAPKDRQISIYRPSLPLANYRIKFEGQLQEKALGWVFRAANPKNYYVNSLEMKKDGSEPAVVIAHYAVVNGEETQRIEKPLPFAVHLDTVYDVRTDVFGTQFKTFIRDQLVDEWSDDRLQSGGFGIMGDSNDRIHLRFVQLFELKGGK